ncbi:TAXI family TRAP transporter solute-binding subunit [Aeromonas veronii]|uniref:TAXI family TRAP transporter solute-binding subunit n=1 Tax=Aeromonas veronii TaxID=654 RepID=UPI0030DA70FB
MKKLAMLLPLLWQPGLMAETVTITTGGEQGIYHQITKEFCRLAHEVDEQLACTLQSSSGSIENLKRLKSGETSYAMVQSDWLYQAANSTSKCNSRLKIRLLSEVRQKPPVAV